MNSPIISIYQNTTDRGGKRAALFAVLRAIRSGRWQNQIESVRTAANDTDYTAAKKQLPAFTASGLFEPTRAAANLKQHSGFIAIDIDLKDNVHLSDLAERVRALSAIPFVSFISKSAGGKGYFVLFRINQEQHGAAYEHISALLKKHFDITTDKACKDVSRLRYISYDAGAYLNENAEPLNIKIQAVPSAALNMPKLPRNLPTIETEYQRQYDDMVYVANCCKAQNLSLLESYNDWYAAAQSLADVFGESGRELLHELSVPSAKYKPNNTDRQFDNCLKRKKASGSLGFIFNQAARHGIIVKERYQNYTGIKRAIQPLPTERTVQLPPEPPLPSEPPPEQSGADKITQLQSMFDLEFTAYNGEQLQHGAIQYRINAVYGCDLAALHPESYTLPSEFLEPPF